MTVSPGTATESPGGEAGAAASAEGAGVAGAAGGTIAPSRPTTTVCTLRAPVLSVSAAGALPVSSVAGASPRRPMTLLSECANCLPPGSVGTLFAGALSFFTTGVVGSEGEPRTIL